MSDRWSVLVRVLALVTGILAVVSVLEARSLRQLRGELQQLRTEREQAQHGEMNIWARQAGAEFVDAAKWLDQFYREPSEGFGRASGLCPNGSPDFEPVATWILGDYVRARTSGKTVLASKDATEAAIRRTDAYRKIHPDGR